MSTLSGGPNIVTNGLIFNLDAANTKSYISGSTSWVDLSRSGNNGTLTNGPTFNSGNGGSLVFYGVNDYINCGNTLSYQNSFTFNIFFKTTNTALQVLIGKYSGIGGDYWIGVNAGKLVFSFGSPTKIDLISSINVNDGLWKMVTTVFNRSLNSTYIYINGVLNNTGSPIPSIINEPAGDLMIGKFGSGSTYYYKGNVGIFSLYNRALTSTEILQNFNATKTRFGL